ncbi:hypothetical protein I7I53_05201 [Histoplasma capsulatum var. duboisii H88]|uniref:Uncharacterized protein n=1 Tax=Ajellomyces capsulatus (strain H88) TaxID=544711 RepID=A0A8A1LUL0_AJEC8|nr:hypothetical protein I7I53_05201 [Histoplasma capsulatum var. duboisii H88]
MILDDHRFEGKVGVRERERERSRDRSSLLFAIEPGCGKGQGFRPGIIVDMWKASGNGQSPVTGMLRESNNSDQSAKHMYLSIFLYLYIYLCMYLATRGTW